MIQGRSFLLRHPHNKPNIDIVNKPNIDIVNKPNIDIVSECVPRKIIT